MGLKQRKRFLPCRSDGKLMPLYYTYAPHCPLYWCCRDHGANAITGDLRFSTPHQCFRIIMQHLKDKHPDELTTNEAAVLSPFFVFLYNERTKMLGERWKVTPPPYIPAAQQPDAAPPPPYKEPIHLSRVLRGLELTHLRGSVASAGAGGSGITCMGAMLSPLPSTEGRDRGGRAR